MMQNKKFCAEIAHGVSAKNRKNLVSQSILISTVHITDLDKQLNLVKIRKDGLVISSSQF